MESNDSQVRTWRDSGRFLTPAELGELTDEQRDDYYRESNIRDLAELEAMPEPQRSMFRRMIAEQTSQLQGRAAS